MKGKYIETTKESSSGRNLKFLNKKTGKESTRAQLVSEINKGLHEDYHVRKINGLNTPVSNPDKSDSNNLG